MDDPTFRLNTKLPNGAEFDMTGDKDTVKEMFALFLDAQKGVVAPVQLAAQPIIKPTVEETLGLNPPPLGDTALDRALLDRLFAQDRLGNVSLRALPRGEDRDADAMLAILYGFAVLRGDTAVTAARLMSSARQSGIQNIRLYRVIARSSQFVTESGTGKGKRYGLNNPGMRQAEAILKATLE